MTMLAAENITVTRGGKTILRDVSSRPMPGNSLPWSVPTARANPPC